MTRNRDVANVESNGVSAVPPFAAGKNVVINGAMQIWQRGTSITGANTYAYTADRWAYRDTNGTPQAVSQVTSSLPTGFNYGIKMGRANGATGTSAQILQQPFETVNSIGYAGQTITLSFYAKKGANYSPTTLSVLVYSGTGTDQAVIGTTGGAAVWTGAANPINSSISAGTLTTSWVRYTFTGTVAAGATQLAIWLQQTGVGTAGADDYIYITGVQLEAGSVATPFTTATGTIAGELAACQRYYQTYGTSDFYGSMYTSGYPYFVKNLPVAMRVAPSLTLPSTMSQATLEVIGGSSYTPASLTSWNLTITSISFLANNVGGGTQYAPVRYTGTASIQASSEL